MDSIQLASSLLFSQSSRSIYPKTSFWGVTPFLNKGSAVPAWISLAPGVQESCAWEAAGAGGHGQPSMCTGGSFIQGAISPPQQRQLDSEERMWAAMESEMVHEKVLLTPPCQHPTFLCCWLDFMLGLCCCGPFQKKGVNQGKPW